MAGQIYTGDTTHITVTFRDNSGDIRDPDTVVVNIFESPVTEGQSPIASDTPVEVSSGVYRYTWTPDTVGVFLIQFVATFADSSVDTVNQEFSVVTEGDTAEFSTLGFDIVLEFSGELFPMYIDPSEISPFFSDVSTLEIAEAIHYASLEVKDLLKLKDDEEPIWLALDYIVASVTCKLSQIHGNSFGLGDGVSIRLGDLSVTGNRITSASVNRGNAVTPCELAAALRKEMLLKTTKCKAAVRGGNYLNPIPDRSIMSSEKRHQRTPVPQGRLDGLRYTKRI